MDRFSLEEAGRVILEHVRGVEETEEISILENADGRILAEDIYALWDNPPFHRSPLDGYAVAAADTVGASKEKPVELLVIDEIFAGGMSRKTLRPGEAVRIMTGAPIPKGADAIIRQEDTDEGEVHVQIYSEVKTHDNYCFAGEDYKKGDLLIKKDTRLAFVEIGMAAGMGYDRVLVYRKPRVALLTTGDEVIMPGSALTDGKIYNSNLFFLKYRLKELGYEPRIAKTIQDDPDMMAEEMKSVLEWADLLVTVGGASVGKKDILHISLEKIHAKRVFWGVDMKPGTPTIFSIADGVPVISLSGNPFGAIANLELLVRPALGKIARDSSLALHYSEGIMLNSFPKKSKRRRFIRAFYYEREVTLPEGSQASGITSTMLGCNCIIDIKAGTDKLNPGDQVHVILL